MFTSNEKRTINQIKVTCKPGFKLTADSKPRAKRAPHCEIQIGGLLPRVLFEEPLLQVINDAGGKIEGKDSITSAIHRIGKMVSDKLTPADWETYETRGHKDTRWRIGLKWLVVELRKQGILAPHKESEFCWVINQNN